MPQTTVSKTSWEDSEGNKREQYRTTVPKGLAEAFDLEGKTVEWEVESQNALTVRVVDDD
jgi:hypothetical protein